MSFYQYFKSTYQSYILLFIILLFVVVYVVINWNTMKDNDYFRGEYTRPILITAIIFLILHMMITWDDNAIDSDNDISDLPKYKFKYSMDNVIKNDVIETNNINNINHQIPNVQTIPEMNTIPSNPNPKPNPNPNHMIQNIQSNPMIQNIQSNPIIQKSNLIDVQSLNNKYKIVNKFDNNIGANNKLNNFINNHSNDSKLSNQNIFISHKNSSKYGLKFLS
jgi:hypothetical protein